LSSTATLAVNVEHKILDIKGEKSRKLHSSIFPTADRVVIRDLYKFINRPSSNIENSITSTTELNDEHCVDAIDNAMVHNQKEREAVAFDVEYVDFNLDEVRKKR